MSKYYNSDHAIENVRHLKLRKKQSKKGFTEAYNRLVNNIEYIFSPTVAVKLDAYETLKTIKESDEAFKQRLNSSEKSEK